MPVEIIVAKRIVENAIAKNITMTKLQLMYEKDFINDEKFFWNNWYRYGNGLRTVVAERRSDHLQTRWFVSSVPTRRELRIEMIIIFKLYLMIWIRMLKLFSVCYDIYTISPYLAIIFNGRLIQGYSPILWYAAK